MFDMCQLGREGGIGATFDVRMRKCRVGISTEGREREEGMSTLREVLPGDECSCPAFDAPAPRIYVSFRLFFLAFPFFFALGRLCYLSLELDTRHFQGRNTYIFSAGGKLDIHCLPVSSP